MKTSFVSTLALTNATRETRVNLQEKLAIGQKEATTARLADVGQTLGYLTERTVSLRQDIDRLSTFQDANQIASGRLSISQTVLENVVEGAQEFLTTLVAARSSRAGASVAVTDAETRLVTFTASMNSAHNGTFLFAGINTDVQPISDYFSTPPSASRTAVETAYVGAFGITKTDPGVSAITAADVQTFLDGDFATLFSATDWATTWSSASDQNISTRITTNERVVTSTNANEEAFRNLASAYTMVMEMGLEGLNDAAYDAVLDKAIAVVGQAIGDITSIRASLGTSEARIKNANESMSLQVKLMQDFVVELEGVDPFEATSNVNALLTQIETAYALTARLQNLSLARYL